MGPATDASSEHSSMASDSGSDYDPLEDKVGIEPGQDIMSPKRLLNDQYGDLGLAASIFQVLGTPIGSTWPVSTLTDCVDGWAMLTLAGVYVSARCRQV